MTNPYWNNPPKKPLTFAELQAAVLKAIEADRKARMPCGCIDRSVEGFIIGCAAHSLIDETENPL